MVWNIKGFLTFDLSLKFQDLMETSIDVSVELHSMHIRLNIMEASKALTLQQTFSTKQRHGFIYFSVL